MNNGPRKAAGVWPLLVAVAVLVPILYVLSIGPAYWLASRDVISRETYGMLTNTVYAPIWWVGYRSPAVMDALQWYCFLWAPPQTRG